MADKDKKPDPDDTIVDTKSARIAEGWKEVASSNKRLAEARALYQNYMNILENPDAPLTKTSDDNDHASINGYSIRHLKEADSDVPLHPGAHDAPVQVLRSLPPRSAAKVSSDAFTDSVLMALCTEDLDVGGKHIDRDPRDEIRKFGDNAAYLDDGKGGAYITILDPNTHQISVYKTLFVERDMHTNTHPNADPNGFSAAGFVRLQVDDAAGWEGIKGNTIPYTSAREYMEHHNEHFKTLPVYEKLPVYHDKDTHKAEVRTEYGGWQVNLENWATPGRIDRGEMSKQLDRVLDFNKRLADAMEANGAHGAEVSFTSHSLGSVSGTMARFYWENNAELKKHGTAGHLTLFEPVAETGAVRNAAVLIAAEKNFASEQQAEAHHRTVWKQTSVEAEAANLLKDTDIVMNGRGGNAIIHGFEVYDSADNNRLAGSRMFEIPFTKGSDSMSAHLSTGMGLKMLDARGPLVEVHPAGMMTPPQLADEPGNRHPKNTKDESVRNTSYGLASLSKAFETDGFQWGKENDFRKTAQDIGESLKLPQQAIDATVEAAHVPNRVVPDGQVKR